MCKIESFLVFWGESDFVPGRPGTEEIVPGFLLLPLSRDKGTGGQKKIVPGQRDNGTSRPLETLIYIWGTKNMKHLVEVMKQFLRW
jgi:hypothetical protein